LLAVQHGRFVNSKPGLSMEVPDLEQVLPSPRPSRSCRDLNHGRPYLACLRVPARTAETTRGAQMFGGRPPPTHALAPCHGFLLVSLSLRADFSSPYHLKIEFRIDPACRDEESWTSRGLAHRAVLRPSQERHSDSESQCRINVTLQWKSK
jgi:hypothetical protein